MTNHRLTAIVVGVLYIVSTVSGILSVVVTGQLLAAESPLLSIAANPARLQLGAFFVLVMGLSLAAMPVFLYPLFCRKNEALALGMVVFRGAIGGIHVPSVRGQLAASERVQPRIRRRGEWCGSGSGAASRGRKYAALRAQVDRSGADNRVHHRSGLPLQPVLGDEVHLVPAGFFLSVLPKEARSRTA